MAKLNLQSGQEVLDIGCGVGGGAFLMANVSRVAACSNLGQTDEYI